MTDSETGWLDALPEDRAAEMFMQCCGSNAWSIAMAKRRPYVTVVHLHQVADLAFDTLQDADWIQAFDCHPRIGDLDSLRMKFRGNKKWSAGEQAGLSAADEDVVRELADGNRAYENKFGFIFIVCASGKSAAEMLGLLRDRLPNGLETEIRIAANEQRKITHLRLEKLLHCPETSFERKTDP